MRLNFQTHDTRIAKTRLDPVSQLIVKHLQLKAKIADLSSFLYKAYPVLTH